MVRLTHGLVCALGLLFTVECAVRGRRMRARTSCFQFARELPEVDIPCSVDGRMFQAKEQYDAPGQCASNVCMGNNEWDLTPCDYPGTPFGWTLIPEDPAKPYPQCCAHAVPPQNIVKDLLDDIQWNDIQEPGDRGVNVEPGNELPPTQLRSQPKVNFRADPTEWYLLLMVDPDSEPIMLHWIVGNIQGDDVSNGEILVEHVGAESLLRRGFHRYLILLYKQHGKLTFEEPTVSKTSIESRSNFSIQDFAEEYKLSNPVALKLYQA